MSDIKQVIIIRKDLKMRRGKEISQCCHASMKFLVDRIYECIDYPELLIKISEAQKQWLADSFTKVVLQVNSEDELLEIHTKAKESGLESHIITDNGLTEFAGIPTRTSCAIGPDYSEKIDLITSHLKLY